MSRPMVNYHLDMRKEEHRAMMLRAYFLLIEEGKGKDAAWAEAPDTAVERWKSGYDWPVSVARRWR